MNSVIAYVDGVKPNAYTDSDKYRWLHTLELMLRTELFQEPQPKEDDVPACADAPLCVPRPYEEIYALYVMAMIDFHNREFTSYNNTMLMFRERLGQLHALQIRQQTPAARYFRGIMG